MDKNTGVVYKMKQALIFLLILSVILIAGCTSNNNTNGGLLSIGNTNTMQIPTDVSCNSIQDCVDYAKLQDTSVTNVQAICEKTCTFITEKTPTVEVTQ